MNALSDALPKIDFDYYRKMVPDTTLVDKLQKEVRIKFVFLFYILRGVNLYLV
jgi:hypothetical protein